MAILINSVLPYNKGFISIQDRAFLRDDLIDKIKLYARIAIDPTMTDRYEAFICQHENKYYDTSFGRPYAVFNWV